MCGLAGVVSVKPFVNESLLRAANDSIRHRGPDEEGIWVNATNTCGLGHVRLSIIDLVGGRQPLSSPDSTIHAIVNGEFYGYEDIRRDLVKSGYQFQTHSDSEILIPLYQKYGEACVEHLRGEYSFILWDEKNQKLFIARDRFGIKPLFYSEHNGAFYVGSEIKALLAMGIPARWDTQTVIEDELQYRDCHNTFFRDIKSLPPGHLMTVKHGRINSQKYWDFDYPRKQDFNRKFSDQEYILRFWELLSDAVKMRLRADVPVGVYLSGGIDSSIVLSLMNQLSPEMLHAFTLSFDHADFDESEVAREMAARATASHSVIEASAEELAPNFEDTVWHNECPFTISNTIAKYILSRHVRDAGLKVVLTGEGSDEVLGGYGHFVYDMRYYNSGIFGPVVARPATWLKRAIRIMQHPTNGFAGLASENMGLSAVKEKFGFVPQQLRIEARAKSHYQQLRTPELRKSNGRPLFDSLMKSLDDSQLIGREPLNKSLYLSSKSQLPNMILTTLGDRVEMAHSIEARLPFLDHKLVEFLTQVPVDLKIKVKLRSGIEKYLLKEAARPHVTETLYRRRKHPFTAPPSLGSRKDPMSEFISDTLHGSDMRNIDLYDQSEVLKIHELSRKGPHFSELLLRITGLAVMQKKFGLSVK
jgi:asparagine synthase (glutamine-hydrolysing)